MHRRACTHTHKSGTRAFRRAALSCSGCSRTVHTAGVGRRVVPVSGCGLRGSIQSVPGCEGGARRAGRCRAASAACPHLVHTASVGRRVRLFTRAPWTAHSSASDRLTVIGSSALSSRRLSCPAAGVPRLPAAGQGPQPTKTASRGRSSPRACPGCPQPPLSVTSNPAPTPTLALRSSSTAPSPRRRAGMPR